MAFRPFEGVCHGPVHREHHVSDEVRDDDVERCVCGLEDIFVDDIRVFDPLAEMREFDADAARFEFADHEAVCERVMPDIDLAGEADRGDLLVCTDGGELACGALDDVHHAEECAAEDFFDGIGLPCFGLGRIFDALDEGVVCAFVDDVCSPWTAFDWADVVERVEKHVVCEEAGITQDICQLGDAFGVVCVGHRPDGDAVAQTEPFEDNLVHEIVASEAAWAV